MWRRVASLSHLISSSRSSTLNQTGYNLKIWESFSTEILTQVKDGFFCKGKAPFISFVLGGPGSGKGTQCSKIVENYGLTHLSAGELLRREIASNSEYGTMILDTIKEGKIVPSEVTVSLIQKEMESSDNHKFLIDGFPRTEENRAAFERIIGAEPDLVLFFDCPEEEMVTRVLSRNEGRVDDNIDTVKKRLKVFKSLNLPVINYYSVRGKLHTINAVGTVDEIFEQVRAIFCCTSDCERMNLDSTDKEWHKAWKFSVVHGRLGSSLAYGQRHSSQGPDVLGTESETSWRLTFSTPEGNDFFYLCSCSLLKVN